MLKDPDSQHYLDTLILAGDDCDSLDDVASFPDVTNLVFKKNTAQQFRIHSLPPSIDSLEIVNCPNFTCFQSEGRLDLMKWLTLKETPQASLGQLAALMPSVVHLYVHWTPAFSIRELSPMAGLRSLYLKHVPLDSLDGIETLSQLDHVNLHSTAVTDIKPLASLPSLWLLNISKSPVDCLHGLDGLTKLEQLQVVSAELQDLEIGSASKSVTNLGLCRTKVKSFQALGQYELLRDLDLSRTNIQTLDALTGCFSLETLSCSSTSVDTLAPLVQLPRLREVFLSSTNISPSEIREFAQARPDVALYV